MDRHKYKSIYNWKLYGVISEDFDKLYEDHMKINNCQLCGVLFDNIIKNNKRCLDHDHKTGLYRNTICNKCNIILEREPRVEQKISSTNTTGYKNIILVKSSNTYKYKRIIQGVRIQKTFKTLQEAIDFKTNIEQEKCDKC